MAHGLAQRLLSDVHPLRGTSRRRWHARVWNALGPYPREDERPAILGAMDPVHGARPVVVITEHGKGAVHRVADRAVLDVTPGGLAVVELAPGYTISDIRACTEPPVLVAPPLRA